MHCITFACSQCFMHYRCVFICWKLCAFRNGLGWTHDAIFIACHMLMHCSCIQTFSFQYSSTLCDGVSLSLSLSLMVCVWHPSANSLRLKTLFVLRHLLLILLLFTFSSVMSWLPGLLRELLQMWHSFGMPRDSIRLFQYYSTYCYSQLGIWISMWETCEFSHHDHSGVLLQHAWFRYLYTSVCYTGSRYTYHSYTGAYFWCTTCSKGIASWLPRVSMFEDCV